MKDYIRKHKVKILFLVLGTVAGLLYWRFIGCTTGSCPITSKWYTSSAYGLLFGWLISDLFSEKRNIKTENKDE